MKKIVSFILVLVLSFGTASSVCAQEKEYDDNNLRGQTYRIIDADGNVVSEPRISIGNPTVPAGYGAEWDVNVVEGRNTMTCSVTPNAYLSVELTNAICVPVYTYSPNALVGGFSTTYISPGAGRGRYRVWNKSSYTITLTGASFNGA